MSSRLAKSESNESNSNSNSMVSAKGRKLLIESDDNGTNNRFDDYKKTKARLAMSRSVSNVQISNNTVNTGSAGRAKSKMAKREIEKEDEEIEEEETEEDESDDEDDLEEEETEEDESESDAEEEEDMEDIEDETEEDESEEEESEEDVEEHRQIVEDTESSSDEDEDEETETSSDDNDESSHSSSTSSTTSSISEEEEEESHAKIPRKRTSQVAKRRLKDPYNIKANSTLSAGQLGWLKLMKGINLKRRNIFFFLIKYASIPSGARPSSLFSLSKRSKHTLSYALTPRLSSSSSASSSTNSSSYSNIKIDYQNGLCLPVDAAVQFLVTINDVQNVHPFVGSGISVVARYVRVMMVNKPNGSALGPDEDTYLGNVHTIPAHIASSSNNSDNTSTWKFQAKPEVIQGCEATFAVRYTGEMSNALSLLFEICVVTSREVNERAKRKHQSTTSNGPTNGKLNNDGTSNNHDDQPNAQVELRDFSLGWGVIPIHSILQSIQQQKMNIISGVSHSINLFGLTMFDRRSTTGSRRSTADEVSDESDVMNYYPLEDKYDGDQGNINNSSSAGSNNKFWKNSMFNRKGIYRPMMNIKVSKIGANDVISQELKYLPHQSFITSISSISSLVAFRQLIARRIAYERGHPLPPIKASASYGRIALQLFLKFIDYPDMLELFKHYWEEMMRTKTKSQKSRISNIQNEFYACVFHVWPLLSTSVMAKEIHGNDAITSPIRMKFIDQFSVLSTKESFNDNVNGAIFKPFHINELI